MLPVSVVVRAYQTAPQACSFARCPPPAYLGSAASEAGLAELEVKLRCGESQVPRSHHQHDRPVDFASGFLDLLFQFLLRRLPQLAVPCSYAPADAAMVCQLPRPESIPGQAACASRCLAPWSAWLHRDEGVEAVELVAAAIM